MRSFLAFLVAFSLVSAFGARLPESADFEEVLALATRREQPSKESGYDDDRRNALYRLQIWPKASAKDEARMVAAFQQSLRATTGNIRSAGASGLGKRGHTAAIPTIFKLGEKEPGLIVSFFNGYTHGREVEPPIDLLRRGLRSKNPDMRRAILTAIASCKAVTLRVEVEALLDSDRSETVCEQAASTLWQLGLPESAAALRRALARGLRSEYVAFGLTQLGTDADVAAVLPLLKSDRELLRRAVAEGLSRANLSNPRPACDALLEALHDPSNDVRVAAVRALGRFREARAITPIRELVTHPPRPIPRHELSTYVDAISTIGGPEAINLLDDMMQLGFSHHFGLERALARFGSPSSARAVWEAYLRDPIRANPGSDVLTRGYGEALDVLVACADAELLVKIQERLAATKDSDERRALASVSERIQARLTK